MPAPSSLSEPVTSDCWNEGLIITLLPDRPVWNVPVSRLFAPSPSRCTVWFRFESHMSSALPRSFQPVLSAVLDWTTGALMTVLVMTPALTVGAVRVPLASMPPSIFRLPLVSSANFALPEES